MDQLLGTRVRSLPANYGRCFAFGLSKQDAEIGVEFEIEGKNLPDAGDLQYHWRVERDGSLRGPSAEYVLKSPVSVEYFEKKSLPYLTKWCHKKKSHLNISGRCSTHVHINAQYMYVYQVVLMATLYYLFEELTVAFTGSPRKGSLFCVGASESTIVGDSLENACSDFVTFMRTQDRYASVNFKSIEKYGSLEFRALKGTLDPSEIMTWITFLTKLRDFAMNTEPKDVPELLGRLSAESPYMFLKRILEGTESLEVILSHFDDDQDTINRLIYKGIDKVQAVFYEPEWHVLELCPVVNTGFDKEAARLVDMTSRGLDTKNMCAFLSGRLYEEYSKLHGARPNVVLKRPKKPWVEPEDIFIDEMDVMED